MKKVYITRKIPEIGVNMLKEAGFEVDINTKDRPLTQDELIESLKAKDYDGVLTLLTDKIDSKVYDAAPSVKIFANYAIGFNNFDTVEAKKRGIFLTNTPGGGAERVAEHTWALILALSCRIVEGDRYIRGGKYNGWDPMLLHGINLAGKTMGVIGTGRIGGDVLNRAKHGFMMNVIYYDIKRNETLEKENGAKFCATVEDVLKESDIISIHVPLMEATHHLINKERLSLMKKTAIVINTSRGPVIDEVALVEALQNHTISGAGLDVFEFEPELAKGLADLDNVVLTPHIASATIDSRIDMAKLSAQNIIDALSGKNPKNLVL
jgi:glyoxylate reductase